MTVTEQRRARVLTEAQASLSANLESMRRQNDAMEAIFTAIPAGLTADEVRAVARRFAQLAEELGPRRGLVRFERPS